MDERTEAVIDVPARALVFLKDAREWVSELEELQAQGVDVDEHLAEARRTVREMEIATD